MMCARSVTALAIIALALACGDDARPGLGAEPAAPLADAALLEAEVTQLVPGMDTAVMHVRDPYYGDESAIADGGRYFDAFNCSGCHAPLGGGGMGPPLSDTTWIYGGDADNIYLSIVQGRPNGMPSWHNLPPDVVWKLVAYIQTLPERKQRVSTTTP